MLGMHVGAEQAFSARYQQIEELLNQGPVSHFQYLLPEPPHTGTESQVHDSWVSAKYAKSTEGNMQTVNRNCSLRDGNTASLQQISGNSTSCMQMHEAGTIFPHDSETSNQPVTSASPKRTGKKENHLVMSLSSSQGHKRLQSRWLGLRWRVECV